MLFRFNINLVCESTGDKAVHLSFRPDHKVVVRNTYTAHPGSWGPEEREGGWPLQANGELNLGLVIKERGTEVRQCF